MDFRPILITDKNTFRPFLKGRYYRLITYTFSTFYMCRNWDPYAWCIEKNALILKSDYIGIDSILCPISPHDESVFAATESAIQWYQQQGRQFTMSEVDEDMLLRFEQHWPGRFAVEEYPPGANYVYLRDELAMLPGKRFDGKRNHINRFLRSYPDYKFLPLNQQLIPLCIEELDRWRGKHNESDKDVINESCGARDTLNGMDQLDCIGAALVAANKVVAFTIGEPLNSDTFAIHIEKADSDVPGAFQAINSFFARDFCQGYRYINRAEDMGEEGIRRAKQSYHPCRIEKKYYLRLK